MEMLQGQAPPEQYGLVPPDISVIPTYVELPRPTLQGTARPRAMERERREKDPEGSHLRGGAGRKTEVDIQRRPTAGGKLVHPEDTQMLDSTATMTDARRPGRTRLLFNVIRHETFQP